MYYVPVTDSYYRLSPTYVPVYKSIAVDESNSKLDQVQKELANLRDELRDLRLEKDSCRLCSASRHSIDSDETCSICYSRSYSRPKEEIYQPQPRRSSSASPIHYCSICQDYVIDRPYPPPPSPPQSPSFSIKKPKKKVQYNDKLSEYLSRQIDVERLHPRYIPEERPVWIPTAYKHDYPHRRWITRQSNFSQP